MKARNNDKVSETLKLCKALFQKKNNYNKHQEKRNFYYTDKTIILIHVPMEIKPRVKVMIGNVSRIL